MAHHDIRSQALAAPWRTLILVCSHCGAARHGPDGSEIRKCLKKRLGKPKSLRILEVDCLKLCPDDGVALLSIEAGGSAREPGIEAGGAARTSLCVVRTRDEVEELAAALHREQHE